MTLRLPVRCKIPEEHVTSDIRWLEIEEADGGYYLYQYIDIQLPPKWDSFDQCLQDVLDDCQRIWGIQKEAWEPIRS